MAPGITVLALSFVYSLVLLVRVKIYFGTRFLVLTGTNAWDTKGIILTDNKLVLLWLIAAAGIGLGIIL